MSFNNFTTPLTTTPTTTTVSTISTVLVTFESLGGIYKILDRVFLTLEILGIIFEATIINFLLWKFFDRKAPVSSSPLKGAFYKISCFQYTVIMLYLFAASSSEYGTLGPNLKNSIANLIKWFFQMNTGVFCGILGVNRCTAVAFFNSHSKIWSTKITGLIMVAMILYSIILQAILNPDIYCIMNIDITECIPTRTINGLLFLYNNGICAIIALIFLFFGIWKSRNIKLDLIRKIEKRLLFQTLLETSFLLFCLTISYSTILQKIAGPDIYAQQNIHVLSLILFYIQIFVPQFALFYASSVFRKNYLHFYYQIFKVIFQNSILLLFTNTRVTPLSNN